jgi:DNA-binding protein Fis
MAMSIWMAFSMFAGPRLGTVEEKDCAEVEDLLRADEELRRNDPTAIVESDDIIAVHQPEVARLIRAKLDETLSTYAEDVDVDDVDAMYHMLLVEVLVLSYAVEPLQADPSKSAGAC